VITKLRFNKCSPSFQQVFETILAAPGHQYYIYIRWLENGMFVVKFITPHDIATWTHTTLEHINGHQDKDKAGTDLPLLAQLNVVAHQLAGTAHQQSCPDPSPRAQLMSHTGVQLHLSTGIVTSQYDQTIRRAYTNSLSISYRQVRYQWPPEVFVRLSNGELITP
jgi:hypothetical protein